MRLTSEQRDIILATLHELTDIKAEVRVFGSRLDDTRHGGDLDLLLVSERPLPYLTLAELKQKLEEGLFLPVDILNYSRDRKPTPFQSIALKQSELLDTEHAA